MYCSEVVGRSWGKLLVKFLISLVVERFYLLPPEVEFMVGTYLIKFAAYFHQLS